MKRSSIGVPLEAGKMVIGPTAAIFLIQFTSDIKLPLAEEFRGVPLWLILALPIVLGCLAFRRNAITRTAQWAAAIFAVLVIDISFSTAIIGTDFYRPLVQAFLIALVVSSCAMLFEATLRFSVEPLVLAAKCFLLVQSLWMLVQIALDYNPGVEAYRHYFLPIWRESGMFTEPSHLAVAITSIITLGLAFPSFWMRQFGVLWYGLVAIIVLLCPATTLLAGIISAAIAYCAKSAVRFALLILATPILNGMILTVAYLYKDQNAAADRIYSLYMLSSTASASDSENVSAIIFAKGIYVMQRSLEDYPLGVGLDSLVYANKYYAYSFSSLFGGWNERDSASILIKAVTEFGWEGAILFALAMGFLLLTIYKNSDEKRTIYAAVGFALFIGNCVRGAGYFDFGFLLGVSICLALWNTRQTNRAANDGQEFASYDSVRPRRANQMLDGSQTTRPNVNFGYRPRAGDAA